MKYGRAIRICRAARGLSQKDMALKAGIKPSYVSLIEAGKRSPSLTTIEKIGKSLDVPTHLLMMLAAESGDVKSEHAKDLHDFSAAMLQLLIGSEYRSGQDG
jgi:transcriptional regulator with XRE-family HTH domain